MERPIILKAHEVRGILDGRQTQLRRIMKPQPLEWKARIIDIGRPVYDEETCEWGQEETVWDSAITEPLRDVWHPLKCPFGQVGGRLWAKETWQMSGLLWRKPASYAKYAANGGLHYRATDKGEWQSYWGGWRSASQMPRPASRILLEIVSVRVERLMDISEDDARANGHPVTWDGKPYDPPPREVDSWQGYGCYSFSLSPLVADYAKKLGTKSLGDVWNANPWVWVVEFKRVTADE